MRNNHVLISHHKGIEIKAIIELQEVHWAQILNYLSLEFKRFVLTQK